jgi:DNA-binding CsgD family transcriptional regulator
MYRILYRHASWLWGIYTRRSYRSVGAVRLGGIVIDKAMNFVTRIERYRSPAAVLDALRDVTRHNGVTIVAAWHLPESFFHQERTWKLDRTVFVRGNGGPIFAEHYRDQYLKNGPSFMSLKGWRTSAPFTFAEAEKEAKARRAPGQWVFGFMRTHKLHDGLYCTFRRWACILGSTQLLALSRFERATLWGAAQFAVGRIEDIMPPPKDRKGALPLTEREREVLQHIALLGDTASVAKYLKITRGAVDAHLTRARRKLKVDTTLQAALTAYKNGWIEF